MTDHHATAARPRIFGAPLRYVQGPHVLREVGPLARLCGTQALLLADRFVLDLIGPAVQASCAEAGVACTPLLFEGEVTAAEIARLAAAAAPHAPAVVVAAGGGKGIDTGKGVARALGAQVITLPTAASNDAPTSQVYVVYDEQHRLVAVERLPHNPFAVVVDTALIARAPALLLRSGIGDALSKKHEVARCHEAGGPNLFGGRGTHAAGALAELCDTLLRRHALPALAALERGEPDEHLESLVEATVLLSGLCFENGGLSIAHALTRGLSALPGPAQALHGLQVAWGLRVQWVLEGHADGAFEALDDFYRAVGLPLDLQGLGLAGEPSEAQLAEAAALTVAAPHTRNFPRTLTADDLVQAMRAVQQRARRGA